MKTLNDVLINQKTYTAIMEKRHNDHGLWSFEEIKKFLESNFNCQLDMDNFLLLSQLFWFFNDFSSNEEVNKTLKEFYNADKDMDSFSDQEIKDLWFYFNTKKTQDSLEIPMPLLNEASNLFNYYSVELKDKSDNEYINAINENKIFARNENRAKKIIKKFNDGYIDVENLVFKPILFTI